MTYQLNGNNLLFAINRTEILDISVKDVITLEGLPGVNYVWTEQDSDFVENNPDDEIFLQIERSGGQYKATGIVLKEA
jgi:hypothetical protein